MWQPIETAPKDGTHVLVTSGYDAHGKPVDDEFGWFIHRAAWYGGERNGGWAIYSGVVLEQTPSYKPRYWIPIPDFPGATKPIAKRVCGMCAFWTSLSVEHGPDAIGKCHYNPVGVSGFPAVAAFEWCRQWSATTGWVEDE